MSQAVQVALTAFAVVFLAMMALTGAAYLAGLAARRSASKPSKHGEEPAEKEVDASTLAVLAAAAYEALKKPVRVHRVHLHREPSMETWSRAGRMDILVSHQHVGRHQ
jgi:hypothetical protein